MTAAPALAKKKQAVGTFEPSKQHFDEGMDRIRAGDYEGATDCFLQSIYFSRNSYAPDSYKFLGLCYKAQRQYPKAIEALDKHLQQVTKDSPDARIDLAECLINIGEYDKARDALWRAASESGVNNARQKYALGEMFEKMGKPDEAISWYAAATEYDPHMGVAFMGQGRCNVKIKRWNEAIASFEVLLREIGSMGKIDWGELYYNLAQCYYKRGDHQGAIDRLYLSLKQKPENFDAMLALARIFDEEKHYDSALKKYRLALQYKPRDFDPSQINKRILFLESKLKESEPAPEIKPSPQMRQEEMDQIRTEEEAQQRAADEFNRNTPKDPGF